MAGLLFFALSFAAFYAGSLLLSVFVQVRLDLPVANKGLVPASILGGLFLAAFFLSLLPGSRRRWKAWLFSALVLFVVAVSYSVHHQRELTHEYPAASPAEILRIYYQEKIPPPFMLTMQSETRSAHVLTPGRPLTFFLDREGGEDIVFSAGAPELSGIKAHLEVDAILSDHVDTPVFASGPLESGGWNDFTISGADLAPFMKSFRVRLVLDQEPPSEEPWLMVTEPFPLREVAAPNVVLVMVDTFRADHLNSETAPFLTELMEKSVVFTQAMAPSSWTVPSTASVLTGLYPHQHGYISNAHMKFAPVSTISRQFKKAGYLTAAVSTNRLIDPRYGFSQGFDSFISLGRLQDNYLNSGRIVTRRAEEWLQRNKDRRFFLYLHYMDPHFPYLAPGPDMFFNLAGGWRVKLGSLYSFYRYDFQHFNNQWLIDHPAARTRVVSRYNGEIRYWDRQFESFVRFLDREGLLSNTVIVVISDHGEAFGEHGNYRHGSSLFEEEIHVPFIIFDPGNPRGLRISTPVSTTEAATIIAGLVNAPAAETWQGRSLDDFMGEDELDRPLASLLSYRHFHPMKGEEESIKISLAARQGKMKVILKYSHDNGLEDYMLFDLADDPGERKNLWRDEHKTELELYAWMRDFMPEPAELAFADETPDDQIKQDLKALGYIQ